LDKIRQRVLTIAAIAPLLAAATVGGAKRFYPDDPLLKSPPPSPASQLKRRNINLLYDFVLNSVAPPGEKQTPGHPIPAQDINTLGEVPDSEWYTNRHYRTRMPLEELRRGPARGNEPAPPFLVTGAKTEGITPGFQMRDSKGRAYFVKIDPLSNPEMASAADVIGSKLFYALGYNTPENYVAYFTREQLKVAPDAKFTPAGSKARAMTPADIKPILDRTPRDSKGRYRIMASLRIEGTPIGPARWYGTRRDDPNDVFPHEHRRTSRGLYAMCAWLNHTDIKSGQTFDTIVETGGIPHVRHYLIDFGSMLGSDSDEAKNVRFGHRYMIEKGPAVVAKMFSAGLWMEDWERANYGNYREIGRITAGAFDADAWTPNYPNPAFLNRLPDDDFWGAKQVMAFTHEEIQAIAATGEYSNARALDYLVDTLEKRRDIVGRTFFSKVLPLDRFEVRNGELAFHNLSVDAGFAQPPRYQWEWAVFDNSSGQQGTPIAGASGPQVPGEAAGGYVVATIRAAGESNKLVKVYLGGTKVVGIDRTW
jgi:hypothetical protein